MHAPGGSPAVELAAASSGSAATATAFVELAAAAPGREPAAAPAERLPATTAAAGREPAAAPAAVAVVRAQVVAGLGPRRPRRLQASRRTSRRALRADPVQRATPTRAASAQSTDGASASATLTAHSAVTIAVKTSIV